MIVNLFDFVQYHSRNSNKIKALDIAKCFYNLLTKYDQVTKTLQIRGFYLSKNNFYNFARLERNHSLKKN